MAGSFDIGWNMLFAVYTLYVLRVLALPPAAYGLIFGIGSLGAFAAALLTGRITRRVGIGRTLLAGMCSASQAGVSRLLCCRPHQYSGEAQIELLEA